MKTKTSPPIKRVQNAPLSLTNLHDSELVRRYIHGDEACLEVLLNRHKGLVFGNIFKMTRDRMLAEDIFQETFFKVISSLKQGNYNEEDKFLPWIMRISRNLTMDHFRMTKKKRTISTIQNSDGEREDIFNVIDFCEKKDFNTFEKRQVHRQIRHLIKRLPENQRQILVMREYFDMSFNEICNLTKLNLNTALGIMRNAIISLRAMAKEDNIVYY